MTLREVTKQLKSLGKVNGNDWSRFEIEEYIRSRFATGPVIANTVLMSIDLADGTWLLAVEKEKTEHGDFWWYEIPDTREQEQKMQIFYSRCEIKY